MNSEEMFADKTDFLTVKPAKIRALSDRRFNAVFDYLEDWNHHVDNLVLVALRRGTDEQIDRARAILRGCNAAGFLTPENDQLYAAMIREFFPSKLELEASARANAAKLDALGKLHEADLIQCQAANPPLTATELFARMAVALFSISTAPDDWRLCPLAREKYKSLALQAFPLVS